MKLDRKSVATAAILAVAVLLGFVARDTVTSGALADQAGKCSAQTLKGSYGIKFEGIKLPDKHFVSVSRITFDGRSSFTTTETGRFEGDLVSRTFTGPYTVNADCTGTAHIVPSTGGFVNLAIVVVRKGKEVHAVVTAPFNGPARTVTSVGIRVQ